jgi:GH15 family glucan-1,4-alpha-glucosidase
MSSVPIADYALLSDGHTSALVSRGGSVDWLPLPRFDSPSVFNRLLDDHGGHFQISMEHAEGSRRSYMDGTMALRTEFLAPGGRLILEDLLALGENKTGHELGADSPGALLRRITCPEGSVGVRVSYAPRPEYGLVSPLLRAHPEGILARGGASVLFLTSPVEFRLRGSSCDALFEMCRGESLTFVLEHRTTSQTGPEPWEPEKVERYFQGTVKAWHVWSEMHQRYEGPWKELVHHSGRVLQALTYYPTGAIVAAPTTSLPEVIGGSRNWDYRFTWLRDASLTLHALWVAACPDESYKFFDFLTGLALSQLQNNRDMQIMFGIGGEHDLSERPLPHLSGWRNSRPVRIGNGAWSQRQLDVYGEILDAAYILKDYLGSLDRVSRGFLAQLADGAARRWQEKDRGIWEVRGSEKHFLHSKLMCWVALDRAAAMADILNARDRAPRWVETREEIRQAIMDQGWSEGRRSFTQSFGSEDLDASVLMMPMVGFIEAEDPRMLSTIEAVENHLTSAQGLVFRYRSDDGLEGEEGGFLLCTFWLAHVYALAGRIERARETMERCIRFVNDVGLMSEEVHPETGELIGNFPQAFSHIGLINAAWAVSLAEERNPGEKPG